MSRQGYILRFGKVVDIFDDADGQRIKVRVDSFDRGRSDEQLPYSYPLLPKMIQIKPKIGEAVLVMTTQNDEGVSNRYYIGPIISQPQFMEKDPFGVSSFSLYPSNPKSPDVAPSTNPDSHGAFAKDGDIAIYGRKKSDIIMTDNDVRIRCGSRLKDTSVNGGIVFNRKDPAFLHLKHTDWERGYGNDRYRSTATLVADKINLIGHNSTKSKTYETTDKNHLISDDTIEKILETAHQLPFGDVLVDFLKLFIQTFINHVHPYPGVEPCPTPDVVELTSYNLDRMLSENVRIN